MVSPFLYVFQSTLPLRGVTEPETRTFQNGGISIHTPLAGSDSLTPISLEKEEISIHTPLAGSDMPICLRCPARVYFNPHSPCGE